MVFQECLLTKLYFQLMKNVENNDVEPVTNLRLSVAQFHQCNPTRLSDSGAGVNAASRVDLAFVASDPLSELVWVPTQWCESQMR